MDDSRIPNPYIPWEGAHEYARKELENHRWPRGNIRCPVCGSIQPIYKQRREGVDGYYRCPALHLEGGRSGQGKPLVFTVRTRTALDRSHVPLDKWLYCFQLLCRKPQHVRAKYFVSAAELALLIDVTRKTALSLLNHVDEILYTGGTLENPNSFLRRMMVDMAMKKIQFPPEEI
jgi:hypothetical protein